MKQPELVTATQAQLDELLALAKPTFPPGQYQLLEAVLGTFVYVMQALQNAKTSIKRFRQMLFGAPTERKSKLLEAHGAGSARDSTNAAGEAPMAAEATPPAGDHELVLAPASPPARAGHGRNGAAAYRDAPVVELPLPDLQAGDTCPKCTTGRVYDSPPRTIVKVAGQPPLAATIYRLERLRCRLCDAIFTAPMPEAIARLPKYDPGCASIIALLRYGTGMPFYRLEGFQASLQVPLADATQWDIVVKASAGPRYAYQELIRQAAQAYLLYNDDTRARILALMHERATAEAAGQQPVAKAINTSGIVAMLQEGKRKVVLFFTGHAHAGQNLEQVLAHRAKELEPPMQMCDALACNVSGEFATIVGHCVAHGRRKFVEVVEQFPEACRGVLECLAKVYANDAHCRAQTLSREERLVYHQAHSGPPMDRLHLWMSEQLAQRQVEPNGGLGRALRYMLKHWTELTLFLREPGAPLDNNLCERALKQAILQRKNSMFYKTRNGAEVGDIYMSLIHTCQSCHVNPFEYLQALQRHAEQVKTHAAQWMPWNYKEQLARTASVA